MKGTSLFAILAIITVAATLVMACHLLVGVEERSEKALFDGGISSDTAAPSSSSDPCTTLGTPSRPTLPDDGVDAGDLVFALSKIDLGLDGGLPFGLNLDRICTCPGRDSCTRPSGTDSACDTDGGRGHDNATASAMKTLAETNAFSEAMLNENLRNGISGALLRIQRYGGGADDSSVTVSFYGAVGFEGGRPTGLPEDRWIVDETSLIGDPSQYIPRYADTNAFVTNNTLVASFDFPLEVGGNAEQAPLRLDLRAGAIVAMINGSTSTPGAAVVRGVLAGRWRTSSILATVETLPDPFRVGQKMCRGTDGAFNLVRNLVCQSSDIANHPALDGTNAPCDALSTVVGFEATLARFGRTDVRRVPPSSCGNGPAPSCE